MFCSEWQQHDDAGSGVSSRFDPTSTTHLFRSLSHRLKADSSGRNTVDSYAVVLNRQLQEIANDKPDNRSAGLCMFGHISERLFNDAIDRHFDRRRHLQQGAR